MQTDRSSLDRRTFLSGAASLAGTGGFVALSPVPMPAKAAATGLPATYLRGSAEYEEKRQNLIWNALKPARFPERIVEVVSEDNVVSAIATARASHRRVSLVSSGHSYVGNGIRDDAVLIALSGLNGCTVDKTAKSATFQPGIRSFDFDAALSKADLAFPVPHNPTVGMAGFLLGGGMGWNAESWNNLACFNLRSVDAILASGERVTADAGHYPDLFWAARGGGLNFPAVATRFHVDVFPRPAAIRESTFIYAFDAADSVIAWMDKARLAQDPKVEMVIIFSTSDPAENKGKAEKQCIVSIVCFADSDAEAKRLYAPIASGAPTAGLVFKEELSPKTIATLLSEDKADVPTRHSVETIWTGHPDEAVRIAAAQFRSTPTPTTLVYLNYRARPTLPGDGAYSAMGSGFLFTDVSWENEKDDAANRKWSDDFVQAFSAINTAAYVNETEFVRHPDRVRHCYSDRNWEKLKAVAAKYDPDGLFVTPLKP